ncbi:hypothetical protein K3740_03460 [Ruegeria conchae]|uniref:hypothetical protein n=1 Tax=Ruegeria conchae TaxID=981384 RepID=UPI0021A297E5|nr:hypothetical protein [Ruegeria conchae]UWR03770.1 hypothetical protein K3740_03460 [Ruegeria conchae]
MSKKNRLFLDKPTILELSTILWSSRPKGIDGLVGDWVARCEHNTKFPKARTRSAIYDWLNNGAPPETDAVLGLAAMLDTDPLTIFDFERNGYFNNFSKLREQIYYHIVGGGRFRSILDLMAPRHMWPNDGLAKKFYGRTWTKEGFEHRADKLVNDYADVHISFPQSTRFAPRCIHIAYRRANSRDKLWRYYGTVQKFRGKTRLFSESGAYVEETETEPANEGFVLKTYYGATHVEFRIASLHEFNCKVVFPSESDTDFLFEPDPRH